MEINKTMIDAGKADQILNAIVPGPGEATHTTETVDDIYRIFATGDDWTGEMRIITGVATPQSLRNAEGSDAFQLPVDDPRIPTNAASPGSVVFNQNVLTVSEVMVFENIKPDEWKTDYPDFKPTGTSVNLSLNPNIQKVVFEILQNIVWNQESRNIVQGGTTKQTSGTLTVGVKYIINDWITADDFTNVGAASNADGVVFTATGTTPTTWTNSSELEVFNTSFIDGLLLQIDADADVIDVANIGLITTTNALTIVDACVTATPPEIVDDPNLVYYTSYADYRKIQTANKNTQQNGVFLSQDDIDKIYGKYTLKWKNSIPENRIFATISGTGMNSNLVKGVWFDGDTENFLMGKTALQDKNWWILLRFSFGVRFRTGKHIVNYKGVVI